MDIKQLGKALSGAGAWFSGQGPQWENAQSVRMNSETDRMEAQRQTRLRQVVELKSMLDSGQVGQAMNFLQQNMGEDVPSFSEAYRSLSQGDVNSVVADLDRTIDAAVKTGDLEGTDYQKGVSRMLKDKNGNMFWSTLQFDGAGAETKSLMTPIGHSEKAVGPFEVVDSAGLTPGERPEQKFSENRAASSGTATGTGQADRIQETINMGLTAARGAPILKRSADLLQTVKTGGWDGVKLKAQNWFGVSGADERELTSNLARAVLSQLKATFGAQFTEREGARLEAIEAGIGNSVKGNLRQINQLILMGNREIDRGLAAAKKANDQYAIEEIESWMNFEITDEALDKVDQQHGRNKTGRVKILSVN